MKRQILLRGIKICDIKYESGLSTPEMDKLIELAKVFEISIDELVGEEKNTIIPEKKTKIKM